MEVSRGTAYRLVRHVGRTDGNNQQFYDMDPLVYIMMAMKQFLSHNKDAAPKEIKTEREAIELCMDVTRTLVLAYYAEKHGTATIPSDRDVDRLANHELIRTLELLRNREAIKEYSDFDPSEARAAHQIQVPFDVALTLGVRLDY